MGSIYSSDYEPGYAHVCTQPHNDGPFGPPDTSGQDSTTHSDAISDQDSTDWWYDPGELVTADIVGGLTGAIGGSLVPGLGTVGGGLAGAFSGSAADFIKQILFALLAP